MFEDIAKQHERLGKVVTEIITNYAATLDSRKVTSPATPKDLEKLFEGKPGLSISYRKDEKVLSTV